MKILVSAYACNPYGGSEPGVGWAAVCRIAKRHDVWVITDIHNRAGWDQGAKEDLIPSNVKVRFLRDRSACSENRFIAHLQSWMNYASFNRQILSAARDWHREIGFDLCHQVTIAGWRMPSPLWQLPIPFVWGPIGGAGYIPPAFRGILSPAARAFEKLRDVNTAVSSRSRAFKDCIQATAVVFAANEETEVFLMPYRKGRSLVRLPIASFHPDRVQQLRRPPGWIRAEGPLRLFAGGNMEGRKGVSLALRALALVAGRGIDFRYIVAGGGPEIPALKSLCQNLGLDERVEFHPGFRGDEYVAALHRSDVYFLPSFRESTPVTLLEACLAGCYPVVADTSAQGEIVRLIGGRAVEVKDVDSLVRGLADGIEWCHSNPGLLEGVATQAADAVNRHFSGDSYEQITENAYQLALTSKS
jgi:glycosyltransferase involved in cell wall biosynthesis